MINKLVFLTLAIPIFLSLVSDTYASTNSTSNVNKPLYMQIQQLIENPFFAPDASCLFDAYQLHCIPGDHQECPKPKFGGNEDGTCFPKTFVNGAWKWKCPDEYHSEDDDETGQCYPDTKPCYPGQIRNQSDTKDNSCSDDEEESNIPDEYCLTNPDQEKCNALPISVGTSNQCPDGFAVMNSANLTSAKCVPEDVEEIEQAERERKVMNPDRCAIGYELNVPENIDINQIRGTFGSCQKQRS